MISRETIAAQLPFTLATFDYPPFQSTKYKGKVRDCFTVDGKRLLVTSDRLSAFDVVLTTIPFKGMLLNSMARYWFEATKDLVPNHIISYLHPNAFLAHEVEIIPVEVVVRGYLTGSAWRDYEAGKAVSGIELPKGMTKYQKFAEPLLTPSTKAPSGTHDEPISVAEVVASGVVKKDIWNVVTRYAMELFEFGTRRAAENGLILVDTKYEFGVLKKKGGSPEILLADEIHTQDSSRYWISSSYAPALEKGEDPTMLDKEFVRRWLIARDYMGHGTPPTIPDDFRVEIAETYIETFERITGQNFSSQAGDIQKSLMESIDRGVQHFSEK